MNRGAWARLAVAAALAAAYLALGFAVRAGVGPLDRALLGFAGHGTAVAAALSFLGTFSVYAVVCAASLLAGAALGSRWFLAAAAGVLTLLCAWVSSDAFKAFFGRVRPEVWYVQHESSFGYSSGHATLSLAFYGFWAYAFWRALPPSPRRTALVTGLCCWIAAIGWARLALGAHYATDVIGGYLLGAVWLLLASVAVDPLIRPRTAT